MNLPFNFFKITLILFILPALNLLNAGDLNFQGIERLNINDLQKLTSIDLKKNNLSEQDINILIKELYQSDQIYDVSSSKIENSFIIKIQESPLIENIYINGNIVIKDDIFLKLINSKKDNFLDKDVISSDIELIQNIYSGKGYDSTIVSVSTEKYMQSRVNLIFDIVEGERVEITRIKFIGNNSFTPKLLKSLIQSKDRNFYNLFSNDSPINKSIFDNDLQLLKNFYKNKGFNNIDISYNVIPNLFKSYKLIFYINENSRSKISNLIFDLSEPVLSIQDNIDLIEKFQKDISKNNYYFDKEIIDGFTEEVNEFLYQKNLNYQVSYNSKIIDKSYELTFTDTPIEPLIVNSIDIFGNTITKSDVILSKLSLSPGDYYTKNKLDKSSNFLSSFKYINNVKYQTKNSNNENKSDVIFEIIENKKTGSILAGGSFTGDVGLGLAFSIKDYNIAGTGNEIQTDFSINSEITLFDITYKQYPHYNPTISNLYNIGNKETDLTSSFGYKLDQKSIGYTLNFKYSDSVNYGIGIGYNNSRGHSAVNNSDAAITDNIGTFDDTEIKFFISQNNTNDNLYPNEGYFNSLSIKYSPEVVSDNSYVIAAYKGDAYYKFENTNDYFFLSNRYGYAKSTNGRLKTNNSFSLGGSNFKGFSYRGIGKKTSNGIYLGGNQFFTSTIGYGSSFIFDSKDDIYVRFFYTVGSIWDSDYIDQDIKIRTAVGTSFDVLTPIGPITFSYSVPLVKSSEDTLRRFNFSIGTSF